jgi:hypothetical protein
MICQNIGNYRPADMAPQNLRRPKPSSMPLSEAQVVTIRLFSPLHGMIYSAATMLNSSTYQNVNLLQSHLQNKKDQKL